MREIHLERDNGLALDIAHSGGWRAEDMAAIAEALRDSAGKYQALYVNAMAHENAIGPGGGESIAALLEHPADRIRTLGLSGNALGDDGAVSIARALGSRHCQVRVLNLRDNHIGPIGAAALAAAIGSPGSNVRSISLGANSLDAPSKQLLMSAAARTGVQLNLA